MKPITLRTRLARYGMILSLPACGALFFLVAQRMANSAAFPNNDFFTFWLAGHMVTIGQNPYISNLWVGSHHQFGVNWIPNLTFIYPLPLGLFFAPFGLLPLYPAFIIWLVLLQLMMLASFWLLLKPYPARLVNKLFLPLLAELLIFRPTILTLDYGQLSGFLLLVMSGSVYLWEKGKWWQGSALLPLLALKPNLGVPIIALLSFFLILKKQKTALVAETVSGLILLMAGWILNPRWIPEFLQAGGTKLSQTFGFSPTVWGASTFLCNYHLNCVIFLGGWIGLFILIGHLYLFWKKRRVLSPALAAGLAITATLLLTPYTWTYDQFLLALPIFAIILGLVAKGYRFLPTVLFFFAIDVLAMALLAISAITHLEIWNVAIPLAVLGWLVWYLSKDRSAA
jgi:hypothetical protein